MTYDTLRHFADTWGLIGLFVIFLAALIFALRPGVGEAYRRVAELPLKEDGDH